jgi:hypothetical protein
MAAIVKTSNTMVQMRKSKPHEDYSAASAVRLIIERTARARAMPRGKHNVAMRRS